MSKTIILESIVLDDPKKTKQVISTIRKERGRLWVGEYLYVNMVGLSLRPHRDLLPLINYVYDPKREKRIFLKRLSSQEVFVSAALNTKGRAAFWIDGSDLAKVLGSIFHYKPYKSKCDYPSLLRFVQENQFVTSEEVGLFFGISRSLALSKLNRLFGWTLLQRLKTITSKGGLAFTYYLPEIVSDGYCWGWLR